MRAYWPKDENVMSWDPENMDKYWSMCQSYDRFPQMDSLESDLKSQQGFTVKVGKKLIRTVSGS